MWCLMYIEYGMWVDSGFCLENLVFFYYMSSYVVEYGDEFYVFFGMYSYELIFLWFGLWFICKRCGGDKFNIGCDFWN